MARRCFSAGISLLFALLGAMPACADSLEEGEAAPQAPTASSIETFDDPIIEQMRRLDEIAPFVDKAPLWSHVDAELQQRVAAAMRRLGYQGAIDRRKLALVLVDIDEVADPDVAAINGDVMMYAASLPKIAVLLAAFEKIAQGKMKLDRETENQLKRMINVSSNSAATEMMNKVGKRYIAEVLLNPRYRLYDPKHNGGLWVGKNYEKAGLWRRDPLHNLSHGATAMQVARFYYLLQTGNLVTPEHSQQMKTILSDSALDHKFVKALKRLNPAALVARKSGSWRTYHSDSVLVERDGTAYIAVAISEDPKGGKWLSRIIVALDGIIEERRKSRNYRKSVRP